MPLPLSCPGVVSCHGRTLFTHATVICLPTIVLSILVSCAGDEIGLFPAGHSLVYQYNTTVWLGTSLGEVSSQWGLSGRLTIQGQAGDALLQLSDVTVTLYNGDGSTERSNVSTIILPTQAKQLLQPFILNYKNKQILEALSVKDNEPIWVVNFKRGLASLLQLDITALERTAFITLEKCVYGTCAVEYGVTSQDDFVTIRKFIDQDTCAQFPRRSLNKRSTLICPTEWQDQVTSSSERMYTVHSQNGRAIIKHITSSGGTYVKPFQSRGEAHVLLVNQSLTLESDDIDATPLEVSENVTRVSLTFTLPELDKTQGRAPSNQNRLISAVGRALTELSDSVDHSHEGLDIRKLHSNLVSTVVDLLSLAEQSSLEVLFDRLIVGTSYHQETVRNLFLDILPQVGTEACALFIKDLILEKKVTNATIVHFFTTLPFHIQHPSEELLLSLEDLMNLSEGAEGEVKNALVLGFASLIYKTCQQTCRPDTLDRYIRRYLDWLTDSSSYADQLLYLDGLSNIELGRVFEYLEPIIRGNVTVLSSQPHHIRYRAIWATASRASYHREQVYQLYWPLLANTSEHLEVRVAALSMLVISQPSPGLFLNLFWFMQREVNPHLYYHYYTTLQSLVDSKYPCYITLGELVKRLARFVRPPSHPQWSSGNYILDYSDETHGFGSLAHLSMVGDERSGLPNVFHLTLSSHTMERSITQLSLFVRIEGVLDAVKHQLFKMQEEESSISKILMVLQQLNITSVEQRPIHLEVAVKLDGRVIFTQYFNHSAFDNLLTVLSNFELLQSGLHLNGQRSVVELHDEDVFSTELGTLVILRSSTVTFTSLRGNLTQGLDPPHLVYKRHLNFATSLTTLNQLSTYNPLLNLWQGVERSHALHGYLLFNNEQVLDMIHLIFKLTSHQPTGRQAGFVSHLRTQVFVRGLEADKKLSRLCPVCESHVEWSGGDDSQQAKELVNLDLGDLGSRIQVDLLGCNGCQGSDSIFKLLRTILDDHGKNSRVLPLSHPLLGLFHMIDYLLLAPPSGVSGYSAHLVSTQSQPAQLELSLLLTTEDVPSSDLLELLPSKKLTLKLLLVHKVANSSSVLRSWDINTVYTTSRGFTEHDLKLKVTRLLGQTISHRLCLEADAWFPEWDPERPTTHLVKGQMNVAWGVVDDSKCPRDSSGLRVTVRAELSDEQSVLGDNKSYRACHVDSSGKEGLLLTEACSLVAREMATMRKYTANFRYTKLPEVLLSAGDYLISLMEVLYPGVTPDSSEYGVMVTAEFPMSRPEVKLTMNKRRTTVSARQPWLLNTLYSPGLALATRYRIINWCIMNSTNLRTFDEAFLELTIPLCYTLASADNSKQPTFAVFVRKVAEKDALTNIPLPCFVATRWQAKRSRTTSLGGIKGADRPLAGTSHREPSSSLSHNLLSNKPLSTVCVCFFVTQLPTIITLPIRFTETHGFTKNMEELRIEPRTSGSVAMNAYH
uniref:(California timema) hypothetical protein n=1 Tax=Timema californicum TaxID=61474 RepID=A0A7R9IUT9_TIMCA|nr:unnamed protein product [Timema californicum]